MSENPSRQDKEELRELLRQFQNLKSGRSHTFLDEEAFEKIIDYYDELEDMPLALEAVELATEQYPYSSSLHLKKADLYIATRRYADALIILDKAEILDSSDIDLYILKTDAFLALDQQEKPLNCSKMPCFNLRVRNGLICFLNWPMCMMTMKSSTKYSTA